MDIDKRGVLLTQKVNKDFIEQLNPRFYREYCKFVVDVNSKQCCIGMDIHAMCELNKGDTENLYGGNLFFVDNHIEYESTLNIEKNLKLGGTYNDARIIEDKDLQKQIDNVLYHWIDLEN